MSVTRILNHVGIPSWTRSMMLTVPSSLTIAVAYFFKLVSLFVYPSPISVTLIPDRSLKMSLIAVKAFIVKKKKPSYFGTTVPYKLVYIDL